MQKEEDTNMRRDEREVCALEDIYDILTRCDTIRISMNGGNGYPYTVPMTFGCALEDSGIVIYFHCAGAGRKWDILLNDPRVCVEADKYYKVEKKESGEITAIYESVIGTGNAELITEKAEKIAALKVMLDQYKESGFPVTSCKGLPQVEVFRIVLDEVSGKHNL